MPLKIWLIIYFKIIICFIFILKKREDSGKPDYLFTSYVMFQIVSNYVKFCVIKSKLSC